MRFCLYSRMASIGQPAIRRDEVDGLQYSGVSNWCLTATLEFYEYESTIYDVEDIIVGTHKIIADDVPIKVFGVANQEMEKCMNSNICECLFNKL